MPEKSLPVIFRKYPDDGEVFALLPTLPGTSAPSTCLSYQHVGQHGSAEIAHCTETTQAATAEEYADLLAELQGIYDENELTVFEKEESWMRRMRVRELVRVICPQMD
jgi:hypothetical protein